MAIYADNVLLPDPLNPSTLHTIMQNAAVPQFRDLVEYHVSVLPRLAPLVRSGKVVLVSADLAQSLALRAQPSYERTPIRDLNDELFVETMTILEASLRAPDDFERKHPIRFRLFGASTQYDSNHGEELANRVFALL